MKSLRSFLLLLVIAPGPVFSAGGCTIIAPGSPDGSMIKPVPVPVPVPIRPDALPQPPPLEASLLFVANLSRSSVNLSSQYATIMTGFKTDLQAQGLQIDQMGLISTYADQFGPRLLLGQTPSSSSTPPLALAALLAMYADQGVTNYATLLPLLGGILGNIDDADIGPALNLFASSGDFDGNYQTCEGQNVIAFGRGLNSYSLPPQLGGIDRSALFDLPHDLFIVVYLQPLARRCAIPSDACNVDGRSPPDIFLDTDINGNATWLSFLNGGMPPNRVVQVSIATAEGESQAAFETACQNISGFPKNLLDVLAPSPNLYFTPLMAALNSANPGTGQSADLCQLIVASPDNAIRTLASSVAGLARSH
jgi:hypothetical protein